MKRPEYSIQTTSYTVCNECKSFGPDPQMITHFNHCSQARPAEPRALSREVAKKFRSRMYQRNRVTRENMARETGYLPPWPSAVYYPLAAGWEWEELRGYKTFDKLVEFEPSLGGVKSIQQLKERVSWLNQRSNLWKFRVVVVHPFKPPEVIE